jgi:hypothetical protein
MFVAVWLRLSQRGHSASRRLTQCLLHGDAGVVFLSGIVFLSLSFLASSSSFSVPSGSRSPRFLAMSQRDTLDVDQPYVPAPSRLLSSSTSAFYSSLPDPSITVVPQATPTYNPRATPAWFGISPQLVEVEEWWASLPSPSPLVYFVVRSPRSTPPRRGWLGFPPLVEEGFPAEMEDSEAQHWPSTALYVATVRRYNAAMRAANDAPAEWWATWWGTVLACLLVLTGIGACAMLYISVRDTARHLQALQQSIVQLLHESNEVLRKTEGTSSQWQWRWVGIDQDRVNEAMSAERPRLALVRITDQQNEQGGLQQRMSVQ